jgi:hypothetical protein
LQRTERRRLPAPAAWLQLQDVIDHTTVFAATPEITFPNTTTELTTNHEFEGVAERVYELSRDFFTIAREDGSDRTHGPTTMETKLSHDCQLSGLVDRRPTWSRAAKMWVGASSACGLTIGCKGCGAVYEYQICRLVVHFAPTHVILRSRRAESSPTPSHGGDEGSIARVRATVGLSLGH